MKKYKHYYQIVIMAGRVEIIIGCMFSGKSTELLRRCNRYRAIDKNVLLINHTNDTRTNNSVETHNNEVLSALKLSSLNELFSKNKDEFDKADVIGIDEAQFFNDLRTFLLFVESYNKIVIIAGLDGDFNRNPFGKMMECIPLCDEVVKLTAMDMMDKDGTPAIFSKRIAQGDETIMVGAKDKYIAVSRKNYLS